MSEETKAVQSPADLRMAIASTTLGYDVKALENDYKRLEAENIKFKEVLFKIYNSKNIEMNFTVYECADILADMAGEALGIKIEKSLAHRYDRYIKEIVNG